MECQLCGAKHASDWTELLQRLGHSDLKAQRCALKRLSTAALPRSLRSEARRRLRELLLEAPGKNSREVLHLEAFELLASAELDGHEASPPWFSSEEIQSSLAAPLMQVLLSHWERDEFSLGKLMMLQLRWVEAGDVAPMAAAGFALKVLRRVGERERTSSAPLRWSEDQLQFLARVSQLARQGLSRLTLPRDQMVPFLVKSLHHFLAAAETNTECQQLCLEILAFLCGKDEDLDCASDIRERYPIDEIWNLMMDADEEFHQANGATPVGAWNYWVIPLLKDKPKDTVLINGIGFVAACVNSEILRMHAMKDLDLLRALEELSQRSDTSEEVRHFAQKTGPLGAAERRGIKRWRASETGIELDQPTMA